MTLRLLLSMSLFVTLPACSKTTGSAGTKPLGGLLSGPEVKPVTDSFCTWAKPIYWSVKDTPETIVQVKLHNVAYKTQCQHEDQPPH